MKKPSTTSELDIYQKFENARKALFEVEQVFRKAGNEIDRQRVYALRVELCNIYDYPSE
jgi:hypothetical protein